jgi:hypothetical protein
VRATQPITRPLGGLVQAHDDALAVEAGDRAGVTVQVQRPGAVVDADPVADPQAGSGDERVGGGQQLLALGDGGGQHGQFGVQFARVDALDQCLDAGGSGAALGGVHHDHVRVLDLGQVRAASAGLAAGLRQAAARRAARLGLGGPLAPGAGRPPRRR